MKILAWVILIQRVVANHGPMKTKKKRVVAEWFKDQLVNSEPKALQLVYSCCQYETSARLGEPACFEKDVECINEYRNAVFQQYIWLSIVVIVLSVGICTFCLIKVGVRRYRKRQEQADAMKDLENRRPDEPGLRFK